MLFARYRNAAYALWNTQATLQLDPAWKAFAWKVPAHILEIIPATIRELIGCNDGHLVVVRNFAFLDICAGKARITKWAQAAGLTGIAIDQEYAEHMNINSAEGFASKKPRFAEEASSPPKKSKPSTLGGLNLPETNEVALEITDAYEQV